MNEAVGETQWWDTDRIPVTMWMCIDWCLTLTAAGLTACLSNIGWLKTRNVNYINLWAKEKKNDFLCLLFFKHVWLMWEIDTISRPCTQEKQSKLYLCIPKPIVSITAHNRDVCAMTRIFFTACAFPLWTFVYEKIFKMKIFFSCTCYPHCFPCHFRLILSQSFPWSFLWKHQNKQCWDNTLVFLKHESCQLKRGWTDARGEVNDKSLDLFQLCSCYYSCIFSRQCVPNDGWASAETHPGTKK